MNPTASKLTAFFEQYPAYSFKQGRMIITAGSEPNAIYFINQGFVRQYDISAKTGLELTLHIFKPHTYLPIIWAMTETPNQYFFEALTDVSGNYAPKQKVLQFLQQNPDVLLDLTKRLSYGLNGLLTRIEYLVFGSADIRVITELVYLAKHFGKAADDGILIDHRFTHYNIAALTGLARETVSVSMEKLAKKDLIIVRQHHIIIRDINKLNALMHEWLWRQ